MAFALGLWGFECGHSSTSAKIQIFIFRTKWGGISDLVGSGWALTDTNFTF